MFTHSLANGLAKETRDLEVLQAITNIATTSAYWMLA